MLRRRRRRRFTFRRHDAAFAPYFFRAMRFLRRV